MCFSVNVIFSEIFSFIWMFDCLFVCFGIFHSHSNKSNAQQAIHNHVNPVANASRYHNAKPSVSQLCIYPTCKLDFNFYLSFFNNTLWFDILFFFSSSGCHLFSVSRPGGSHLRMVIAVGKKMILMTWKHNAAWSAWCKAADTDTVEGFQFTRVSM